MVDVVSPRPSLKSQGDRRFSDPYAGAAGYLVNSGSSTKVPMSESGGIKVAKNRSTGYFYAQEHLPNAQIIALSDESACVTEVSQGKADAFIYDQLTIYRNWQAHPDTTKAVFIPFQDVEYWGCAVAKGNSELCGQINEFIKKYTDEGGWDELTEKSSEKNSPLIHSNKWFDRPNERHVKTSLLCRSGKKRILPPSF